jgi:hypothetical protein
LGVEDGKFQVSDRVKLYKINELLKIENVEINPDVQSSFLRELQGRKIQNTERNIQRHKDRQSSRRRLNREGI